MSAYFEYLKEMIIQVLKILDSFSISYLPDHGQTLVKTSSITEIYLTRTVVNLE